jgi:NADH-quinone oxidoreductase subunit N
MKYFVLGALSSGLLLYGMSMIYGATGTLVHPGRGERASARSHSRDHNFLVFGLVFVVAGVAFKLGVVPFHMWIPDVYHGAPTPVTLVIGAGPKLAAFAMAVRLLVNALPALAADWQQMLALLAICRWRWATSPRSRSRTSSGCSPTRRSRTWASCCSACSRAWWRATG